MTRDPITIEVRPIKEQEKYAQRLLWAGLGLLAAGILLLIVPVSLNIMIALFILLFGSIQLFTVWKQPNLSLAKNGAWLILGFGLITLLFPQLLNFLLFGLFIVLNIVLIIVCMSLQAYKWMWLLIGLSLISGILMVSFPLALNIILAIYLIILGIEQLLMAYQAHYRWKWFN